jgi:2-oxoisovalerate dehydrogenase E1 component
VLGTHVDIPAQPAAVVPSPPVESIRKALVIRMFEERLLKLFSEGKLNGTVHTCIGQEWTGVAVAEHLQPSDILFSNHRCHGHYLARTGNYTGLFAEIMGREAGICRGRGGSQHICDANVFSNGIQGGIVPVASGMALAQDLDGSSGITVVFIGDGTLGEGAVYESLNIAAKWELPLLIVVENNRYSQSTPQAQNLSGDIEARARAFSIGTMRGTTEDPSELINTVGEAIGFVREMRRPLLIVIDTNRLMAHSKGDDDRAKEEVDAYWNRDFLHRLQQAQPALVAELAAAIAEELDTAVGVAEASPIASGLDVPEKEQPCGWTETIFEGGDRVVNRIHAGLAECLANDDRVILLGEDIAAPYGGAFKVTKDLSDRFPGRVRNTPISELAITGIGNGLALRGKLPVVEIMFGDFIMLAADQWINHAAKFRFMYGDQVTVPLVIRTPMGGKRGYGPTHSQSLEKHLLGVPGTRVLAIHHRFDPARVYMELLGENDRPTLVIENKTLYGERAGATAVEGFKWFHSSHAFPISYMHADQPADATILCTGGMLKDAEAAVDRLFLEHDLIVEILCPTQIFPLQIEALLNPVQKSGRLLIVEEGHEFCGLGAEILAQLYERDATLKIRRLASHPQHIPSSKPAELETLPGTDRMVDAILSLEKLA